MDMRIATNWSVRSSGCDVTVHNTEVSKKKKSLLYFRTLQITIYILKLHSKFL